MAALLSILGGLAVAALLRGRLAGAIPPRARRPLALALLGLAALALLARQPAAALGLGAAGAALLLSARHASRPRRSGRSTVRTDALEMTLDHESGEMRGRVLSGAFAGRELDELDREERLRLAAELEDERSLALLRSWMDRHDPGWRGVEAGPRPPPGAGPMTREAAYRLLGLTPGADAAEIREAHRRLMKRVHPDAGGSETLAAQVNEAKDLLLGR